MQNKTYNKVQLLFILSGASSLVVETVLAKLLGYILGITAHATAIVLAAFMAGLAIGSWALGRLSERVTDPIRLYGTLELAVGLYAASVPFLYPLFAKVAPMALAGNDVSPALLASYRYTVATIVVILPAIVMGGTLPLLIRGVVHNDHALHSRVSRLYGLNTLGATGGTLIATYITIYYLGLHGSLWLVTLINLYIYVASHRLSVSELKRQEVAPTSTAEKVSYEPQTLAQETGFSARMALTFVFLTGFVTFLLENVWTHTLATIVGMSVYAFGAMLGTLLLGIGLGALWLEVLRRRLHISTESLLARILIAGGALIALTVPLWDGIPLLLPLARYLNPGFFTMELVRLTACMVLILPPALCVGATFPLLLELYAKSVRSIGARVGRAYAWNTVGGILGSLSTGFILLGRVPSQVLIELCAATLVIMGLVALFLVRKDLTNAGRLLPLGSVSVLGGLLLLPTWDLDRMTNGAWITYSEQTDHGRGEMIEHVEDASSGFITVHKAGNEGGVAFFTNGKFDAAYPTPGFQRNQALIPAMFQEKLGTALSLGLGGGGTLGVLYRLGYRDIDGVDLSKAMTDLAVKYNHAGARGAFDDKERVHLHVADGRNFLLHSKKRYDLIAVTISTVWFASSGNLFNREFYELAKARMTDSGIIATYLQLKQVDFLDLLIAINTMRQVFPYVAYFNTREQAHLIGSMKPLVARFEKIQEWNNSPGVKPILSHLPEQDMFNLLGGKLLYFDDDFSATFDVFDRVPLVKDFLQSTDLHPWVEYATPRGVANRLAYEANYFRLYQKTDPYRVPTVIGIPSQADALAVTASYHVGRAFNSRIPDLGAAIRAYTHALELRDEPVWRDRLRRLLQQSDPAARSGLQSMKQD